MLYPFWQDSRHANGDKLTLAAPHVSRNSSQTDNQKHDENERKPGD